MKRRHLLTTALTASLALCSSLPAQDKNASLRQELDIAISKGLNFLKQKQNAADGSWSTPEEPAITGLVLTAFMGDPSRRPTDAVLPEVDKGYQFLLSKVKPDGGIYSKGRANYNTSIALTALTVNPKPEYEKTILDARRFVVGQQNDFDKKGEADNEFDGGIGYGKPSADKPPRADLSNTHFAIEALYYSKKLFEDKATPEDKKNELNWGAAIKFVERCQNLPASNDQKWASDDPKNKGGFIYEPGISKSSEEVKLPDGRTAMRSYGSISYAGMLSFIYAGLTPDDPRVKAALQWLGENYTLEENPGMGQEGLYYYYHTMAKALAVAGQTELKTKEGKAVDWRTELARHLLNVQKPDGSWLNATGRWMENDPVLVTAYTLLALEHVHRALK
ncbi:squalene-hopene/tetraprenyl-beta-curcumene cyclase [Roseimicrobium gellanilyticum]|uniref:Squalene-hopene/tetraprenyl-beta-curcumene cyclase n=1 Tax=Roseimicrobium gellanilyticum TaxID=748857 RepID=A0A366HR40_9BACT|nr:prenyltransferase/squalene oxidase repeat-containing protein [Roseimicrobium gellanilyticum]RBP44674.1 squalene-hopene/tetraprenyl-beta-curcumene cyclase [Roseimicrobium gellanilyticum]